MYEVQMYLYLTILFKMKTKNFFPVLFLWVIFSLAFSTLNFSGDGCDGCKRTALLKEVKGINDLNSFRTRLNSVIADPCFHLVYRGDITELGTPYKWKSPINFHEYYFTAKYESDLKGPTYSKLSIELFFENGELVHQWQTESERSSATFHSHLQKMFINDAALFRKWTPLEVTLLNDFEKQPSKCDINPDQEELFPGQETKVKISGIVDFEGRKSREFNRIVVQAVDGEIKGGTPLSNDPGLMAFQVEDGEITFTYRAPDGERVTEDKIIVYNSCDILRKDEYPMAKTGLKDKIAEKKIKLTRYEGQAIVKMTENGKFTTEDGVETTSATINVVLKYTHTQVDEDRGFVECYNLISWNVSDAIATWTVKDKYGTHKYETHKVKKDEVEDEEKTDQLLIFFDKTGKAESIEPPNVMYWFIFDDLYGVRLDPFVDLNYVDVKGGDGIHEMVGGGTGVVGGLEYTVKWEIKRYRK